MPVVPKRSHAAGLNWFPVKFRDTLMNEFCKADCCSRCSALAQKASQLSLHCPSALAAQPAAQLAVQGDERLTAPIADRFTFLSFMLHSCGKRVPSDRR